MTVLMLVLVLVLVCVSDQQVEMIGCATALALCSYSPLAQGQNISDCHHLNM